MAGAEVMKREEEAAEQLVTTEIEMLVIELLELESMTVEQVTVLYVQALGGTAAEMAMVNGVGGPKDTIDLVDVEA